MKKKSNYLTIILAVLFLSLILIVLLMANEGLTVFNEKKTNQINSSLANPASVYCVRNGGRLVIKSDVDGSQYALCVFNDRSECEEWAYFKGECGNISATSSECNSDSDCVPASCCHASSCVSKDNAPNCSKTFCTMECAPGTLDCGQGSCKCVNNKCSIDLNLVGGKKALI